MIKMNQCKYLKKIDDDNNYIKKYLKRSMGIITSKKYLKRSMMMIITSKIFKKIEDDNNYIKKYLKRSVGIIRSKIFKGIGGNNYIKNTTN